MVHRVYLATVLHDAHSIYMGYNGPICANGYNRGHLVDLVAETDLVALNVKQMDVELAAD